MPLLPGDPQLSQNQAPAQLAWQNRPTRMPQFMGTGDITPPPTPTPAPTPTPTPNPTPTPTPAPTPGPQRPRTRLGRAGNGDDPYLWENTPNAADQNESTARSLIAANPGRYGGQQQSGGGMSGRQDAMRTRMAGARQGFASSGFSGLGLGGGGNDPNRQGGPATSDVPQMSPQQYAASRVYTPPSNYVPPATGAMGPQVSPTLTPGTSPAPQPFDNGAVGTEVPFGLTGGQPYDNGAKGYPAPQFARGGRTSRGC